MKTKKKSCNTIYGIICLFIISLVIFSKETINNDIFVYSVILVLGTILGVIIRPSMKYMKICNAKICLKIKRKLSQYCIDRLLYIKNQCEKLEVQLRRPNNVPNNQIALTPINKKEHTIYTNYLKRAIDRDDINNIALSGPYGCGKSTILRTFQYLYPQYQYLNISLASFQDHSVKNSAQDDELQDNVGTNSNQGNEPQRNTSKEQLENNKVEKGQLILSVQDEQQIELSILQQMFYQVKKKKIRDSRFKRISRFSFKHVIFPLLFFLIWFCAFCVTFDPRFIDESPIGKYLESDAYKDNIWLWWLCIFVVILGFFILGYYLLRLLKKSHFKALSVENCGIELDEECKTSVLNRNLDEILYYFEVTNFNIVIFEDLDRFDNPAIFIKLRELNLLINKSDDIKRRVVFIYALRDNMFDNNKHRTKFFDYIIPVIPFINVSNSGAIFLNQFIGAGQLANLSGNKEGLSKDFINEISIYIGDMRLLLNIYNEYLLYSSELNVPDVNKLLAMVVYKNMYPSDFVDLHLGKGIVANIMKNKNRIFEKKIVELNDEIRILQEKLTISESNFLNSKKELRMLYVGAIAKELPERTYNYKINNCSISLSEIIDDESTFQNLQKYGLEYQIQHSSSSEIEFSQLESIIEANKNYDERLKEIEIYQEKNIRQFKDTLERAQIELGKLYKTSIADFCQKLDIREFYPELKDNDLLFFLLSKGYIDENYYYYISIFHEGSITPSDNNFLLAVKKNLKLPYEYQLHEIKSIVNKLAPVDFEQKAIRNYNLLTFLWNNHTEYITQFYSFINLLIDDEDIYFIDQYLFDTKLYHTFLPFLFQKWERFIMVLLASEHLTDERKNNYIESLFIDCDIDLISKQNYARVLSNKLAQEQNVWTLFVGIDSLQKCKDIIVKLDLKIHTLEYSLLNEREHEIFEFLYEESRYTLTLQNIIEIFRFKDTDLEIELLKANFSAIRASQNQKLINYIEENLDVYCEHVNLPIETNVEENDETTIYLLNSESVKFRNKEKFIEKNNTLINNLSEIADKKPWSILIHFCKISPVWNNMLVYYEEFGMDNYLQSYLNEIKNIQALVTDNESSILSDEFIKAMLLDSQLSIETFKIYIDSGNRCCDLNIEELSKEKAEYLLKTDLLEFSPQKYEQFQSHRALSFRYLDKFSQLFEGHEEEYSLSLEDIKDIIESQQFNENTKYTLITHLSVQNLIDFTTLAGSVINYINKKYIPLSEQIVATLLQLCDNEELRFRYTTTLFENNYHQESDVNEWLYSIGKPFDSLWDSEESIIVNNSKWTNKLIIILKDADFIEIVKKTKDIIEIKPKIKSIN